LREVSRVGGWVVVIAGSTVILVWWVS